MKSETYSQNNEVEFKFKCCDVDSMCGSNLRQGVVLVASTTTVISLIILLSSVTYNLQTTYLDGFNKKPVAAVNFIFSLVATSISSYQIPISLLLFWQAFWREKSNLFLFSLWYVSHISILTVYCILFIARAVVCFTEKLCFAAIVTIFVGFVYEVTIIYFCIIVNSYMLSLNQVRYF